jgi:lipopolysaccharide transport system ATP-binding protein
MSDVIIRADGLGKQYRLGARARYDTLRERIAGLAAAPWRRLRRRRTTSSKAGGDGTIWALKDVSFEVRRGEIVGIIGRNGAGKSTLLKILSRITEPTEGGADLEGRVGSLLEVGTGFHQELTGRENIYLNGAILGMKRAEIARRFDEIVAFAEVGPFIDTPVKHYSSGMFMRLGFAVAAHLEPEILVVDEVLAVGDAEFQNKCLGKMRQTARSGRTVLFVSHNMASICELCSRVLLLEAGRVTADGDAGAVVRRYCERSRAGRGGDVRDWPDRDPEATGQARIVHFETHTPDAREPACLRMGLPLRLSMEVEFHEAVDGPTFGVLIRSMTGEPLVDLRSVHGGVRLGRVEGAVRLEATIPSLALYPGEYLLSPWVADHTQQRDIDWARNVVTLVVLPLEEGPDDLRRTGLWAKYWVPSHWRIGPASVAASAEASAEASAKASAEEAGR